jgi:hypothetical protein
LLVQGDYGTLGTFKTLDLRAFEKAMAPDDFQDSPWAKALQRQKELQEIVKAATETIKTAMQELEKLRQFTEMYRSLATDEKPVEKEASAGPKPVSSMLRGAAHGEMQTVFQSLALDILRDVGRPMKSTEFIEQFRKRGYPLGGNEVRTAWNRLWEARTNGALTHMPKLGYWIAGEPLTKEAEERALITAQQTRWRKRDGPSLVTLGKGKPKGPPRALNAEQLAAAERLLLAGQTLKEVAALYGIAIRTLVIPKRPYVRRPPRPGYKPTGRPPKLNAEQSQRVRELRDEGKRVIEIAEIMGVGRATIYKILNKDDDA